MQLASNHVDVIYYLFSMVIHFNFKTKKHRHILQTILNNRTRKRNCLLFQRKLHNCYELFLCIDYLYDRSRDIICILAIYHSENCSHVYYCHLTNLNGLPLATILWYNKTLSISHNFRYQVLIMEKVSWKHYLINRYWIKMVKYAIKFVAVERVKCVKVCTFFACMNKNTIHNF